MILLLFSLSLSSMINPEAIPDIVDPNIMEEEASRATRPNDIVTTHTTTTPRWSTEETPEEEAEEELIKILAS